MNKMLAILIVLVLTDGGFFGATVAPAETLTFDDLPSPGAGNPPVPNGYGGLDWTNVWYVNPVAAGAGNTGAYNGIISGSNVAFNPDGYPATISSTGSFTFNSGYFTAVWNDGLNLEAVGSLGGTVMDTTNFTLNASSPTLEILNWANIDTLTFTSSGGTPHPGFIAGGGTQFVMDNLSFNNPVPEPGSTGLLLAGGLCLLGYGWRRRYGKRNLIRRSVPVAPAQQRKHT